MDKPRLPKIGEFVRHHGRLIAIETIPPPPQPPPKKDYIFEEIEAECRLRFNGEIIKEIQTLTDFYGLETGIKTAIKEMKKYVIKKKIGPESDLEVVVIKVERQFRARPTNEENFYDKTFFDFDALDYGSQHNVPDPVRTVVWSSKINSIG